MTTIGLIGLGDMGAAVGRSLVEAGHTVLSSFAGRSAQSVRRAEEAGIADAGPLAALIAACDPVLSIVPPGEARRVVMDVSDILSDMPPGKVFADLNAVAPETSRGFATEITYGGGLYIDGSIIGAAPFKSKVPTRIYLSGPEASRLTFLSTEEIDAKLCGSDVGAASGLKMVYAAYTKGTMALSAAVLVAAERMGLYPSLAEEFAFSQSDRFQVMKASVPFLAADSVRWADEMDEIAASFAAVGVTSKFHEGAGDLFRLLAKTPLEAETRETLDRTRSLEEALKIFSRAVRPK